MEYIQCFAQNTILSETCDIDPEGILSFLMDIEQMTWRQICFMEGFNRGSRKEIEIIGMPVSDVNGRLRLSEIQKLVDLNYLSTGRDGLLYSSGGLLSTDKIRVQQIGTQLAMLMDLKSIPIDEIARAFGTGMIKATITY